MNGLILFGDAGSVAQAAADTVTSWSFTDWVPVILAILAVLRQLGIAPAITDTLTKLIQAIFKIDPNQSFGSPIESSEGVVDTIDTLAAELDDMGQKELADSLRTQALPELLRRRRKASE